MHIAYKDLSIESSYYMPGPNPDGPANHTELLYGLGLIVVFVAAAKANLQMKYLFVTGAVIGIGLFYRVQLMKIKERPTLALELFACPHRAGIYTDDHCCDSACSTEVCPQ
jgi:hypothetical protein